MSNLTEAQELALLQANSPYSLPDDPSKSGWSTAAIKKKFVDGLFILYDMFKESRTGLNTSMADLTEIVGAYQEAVDNLINGSAGIRAEYDVDGNAIKITYAKLADLISGDKAVLKYIKKDGVSKENIYKIEEDLATLLGSFNTLLGRFNALNYVATAGSAEKATKDYNGNVIHSYYGKAADVLANTNNITRIVNGTTIVDKAYKDGLGRRIDTTYLTQSDDNNNVKFSDLVDNLTTENSSKPLTAKQGYILKGYIDQIMTLLGSDNTSLDTLQEIVDYVELNRDLITAITTSKVNVADIIDNLTTDNASKPLSAKQGKYLYDTLKGTLTPISNNTKDLGSSSYKYKDLYLAGNLTDGTNTASVSDLMGAVNSFDDLCDILDTLNNEEV